MTEAEAVRRVGPSLWRRLGLIVHILLSVGLLGAIASFFSLVLVGMIGSMPPAAAFGAAERISTFVIVPAALVGWAAAVAQALATPWGLAKHYWVLVKLAITTLAVAVLLAKQPMIQALAAKSADPSQAGADMRLLSLQLLVHAGVGFSILVVPLVLSILKPPGRTGLKF